MYVALASISYQLTRRKSNPIFSVVEISLRTVVLNSRDCGGNRMASRKFQPGNRLYLKKPAGMHW